jgi:hypothetical protein
MKDKKVVSAVTPTATHTPTPWHRNIKANGKYPTIFAGRNNHICTVAQQSTGEETEANIDFIIGAVNSHEALLDILTKMTDQIDKHFYSLPESNENDGKYWKRLYESACDIIAQAKGK